MLLNLVRDYAELSCAELDLDALEQIAKNSAGILMLFTPDGQKRTSSKSRRPMKVELRADEIASPYGQKAAGEADAEGVVDDETSEPTARTQSDTDSDDGLRLAPVGTELRTTRDKPLSRAAAMQLVELSDEDDWANEVWSFWARSHHRRLDQRVPFVTGIEMPVLDERTTAMLDARAVVVVDEENPIEVVRRRLVAFAERTPVGTSVRVTVANLTGSGAFVTTEDGIEGLIKREELSWKEVMDPARFVAPGETLKAQYLGIDEERNKLVLSYRQAQDAVYRAMKELQPEGSVVEATVRAVAVSTVYLDLHEGVTGEIKLADLAYEPPASAKDLVSPGDTLRVAVKRYNDELRLVELSAKALLPNPFPAFAASHPEGTVMEAPVTRVGRGVLDLRLAEGVRGFVMGRDFAATRIDDLTTVVAVGDVMRVRLMKHHTDRGETQASTHPFDVAGTNFHVGQHVMARVTGATKGLAKVELDGGLPCVIRAGEFAHDRPEDMAKEVTTGQGLHAEVLEIDTEHREIKLSVKRLLPPAYTVFKSTHVVGQRVTGTVTNTISSFAFIKLSGGAQGSIHVRHLSTNYVSSPDQVVTKGQMVQPVIIGFDDARERVNLSLTALATAAASATSRQSPAWAPHITTAQLGPLPPVQPTEPVRATRPPQPTLPVQQQTHVPKRSWISEGKSVEEAVALGCGRLKLQPQQVRVEVLDEGLRGLFGRVKRVAKVLVTEL